MTRRFDPAPLPAELLERVLDQARRVPSAGFSQGVDLLVATGAPARRRLWGAIAGEGWLASPGAAALLAAPVLVLPVADPGAYVRRYGEPDKAGSGLANVPAAAWPTPYWLVDAAFSVFALLLAAEDAGVGALFFRLHRSEQESLAALGIPEERRLLGAVALGRRAGDDVPGMSARRPRRDLADVVHREHW